jgi:hypothetical protein
MTEEEKVLFQKYGRLPKKTDIMKKRNARLHVFVFVPKISYFPREKLGLIQLIGN